MYEYFAATLPMLSFGAPPPMEAAALLASAEGNLTAKDFSALAALLSDEPSDHPFVRAWRDRDTQIRKNSRSHCLRIRIIHFHLRREDTAHDNGLMEQAIRCF